MLLYFVKGFGSHKIRLLTSVLRYAILFISFLHENYLFSIFGTLDISMSVLSDVISFASDFGVIACQ